MKRSVLALAAMPLFAAVPARAQFEQQAYSGCFNDSGLVIACYAALAQLSPGPVAGSANYTLTFTGGSLDVLNSSVQAVLPLYVSRSSIPSYLIEDNTICRAIGGPQNQCRGLTSRLSLPFTTTLVVGICQPNEIYRSCDYVSPPDGSPTESLPPSIHLVSVDLASVVATPEPATLALVSTGLLGLGGVVRRRAARGR